MHHELVKAHLKMKGYTIAAVARELGITGPAISRVLWGARSRRVEKRVAEIIGLDLAEVFPYRYKTTDAR